MNSAADDFDETDMLTENESKRLSPAAPIALTAFLFLGAVLLITHAPLALWDRPYGSETRQVVASLFGGMLLSLPILLSLWMVLGGQVWFIRIPLAALLLAALLGMLLATINIWSNSVKADVFWSFVRITLAVSATAHIVLWTIRTRRGTFISRKSQESNKRTQLTIEHLLITTTIVGLSVPLLRWFWAFEGFNTIPGRAQIPLSSSLRFYGAFMVVFGFLTFLSVQLVFIPKLRISSLSLLALAVVTLPVVVPAVCYLMRHNNYSRAQLIGIGINVFAFSISNAATMIVVLSMYYAVGFRLRRQYV